MAYTLDFAIALSASKAGLSDLRAQLVDTAGADVGSAISTGFAEIGSGNYLWHCTTIPDAHRGGVKFYSLAASTVILAFAAINPEEAERVADIGDVSPDYKPIVSAAGVTAVNVTQWNSHAVPAENVNGYPKIDLLYINGSLITSLPLAVNATYIGGRAVNDPGSNVTLPAVDVNGKVTYNNPAPPSTTAIGGAVQVLLENSVEPNGLPTIRAAAVAAASDAASAAASAASAAASAAAISADYQQRGESVTLPETPPEGYGGEGPTVEEIAAAILLDPTAKIYTDDSGNVRLTYSAGTIALETLVDALCAQSDVEAIYGVGNVAKWADLSGNRDAGEINATIASEIAYQTEYAYDRLRGGPLAVPLTGTVPLTLRRLVATLVGVGLYENRGTQDFNPESGQPEHRFMWKRKWADGQLDAIRAGKLRLNATGSTTGPGAGMNAPLAVQAGALPVPTVQAVPNFTP
jgi:hypothetical protein